MDNIHYEFIDVEIPDFDPEFFDLWLSQVCLHYRKDLGELTFIFCNDDYLLELNRKHLDHDYFTDVITFDYNDKNSLSGDVFVSYDRVKDNALVHGNNNCFDELCRVMCHGLLHLVGYNDKNEDEEKDMRDQEDACLKLR